MDTEPTPDPRTHSPCFFSFNGNQKNQLGMSAIDRVGRPKGEEREVDISFAIGTIALGAARVAVLSCRISGERGSGSGPLDLLFPLSSFMNEYYSFVSPILLSLPIHECACMCEFVSSCRFDQLLHGPLWPPLSMVTCDTREG